MMKLSPSPYGGGLFLVLFGIHNIMYEAEPATFQVT